MNPFTRCPVLLSTIAWVTAVNTATSAAQPSEVRRPAPAPLFRDPVHDGAADPTLVWNRQEKCWWMLYTNRRADADAEDGKTLTCDRDADFDFVLQAPAPEFPAEHIPTIPKH